MQFPVFVLPFISVRAVMDGGGMAESQGIYRCEACGNVIKVLFAGAGQLSCCGLPMDLLVEQSSGSPAAEHFALVRRMDDGYRVTVGGVPHPMQDDHYIVWIEFFADGVVSRRFLTPGSEPAAIFHCPEAGQAQARIYCSVHGLWRERLPESGENGTGAVRESGAS